MHNADDDDDDECPELVSARVPVTILTGFLGSGKTTLLHYILSAEHALKIAVIVNEFEFGKSIEKGLTLRSSTHDDDEWVELKNGCMCCSASTATVAALESLIARKGTFDVVLVETAGLADPAPVAAMFWQDAALCGRLYLSGIVALVDALHIRRYLADAALAREATRQIVVADTIVLNKCDVASAAAQEAALAAVRAINPVAAVVRSCHARVVNLRELLFIDTTTRAPPLSRQLQLPHLHTHDGDNDDSASSRVTALSLEFVDATRMLALHARDDVDEICKELLYSHDDVVIDDDHDAAAATTATAEAEAEDSSRVVALPHHMRRRNDDDDDDFEVLRCKAALWLYTRNNNNNNNNNDNNNNNSNSDRSSGGVYTLLQLQSIGRVFDVHIMAAATTPLCCSRVLVLGRRLDEARIRDIFARRLRPTVCDA